MRSTSVGVVMMIAAVAAGCATASYEGQAALRQGRYAEAATRFEQVVSEDPTRVEGLLGLGIARYKLRDFTDAERWLTAALAREPNLPVARLYLGLIGLQTGNDALAEEHLGALRTLGADPRISAQIDRTLQLLRGDPPSQAMRDYMAATLEDEVSLARDLAATQQALRESELRRISDQQLIYYSPRRCRC